MRRKGAMTDVRQRDTRPDVTVGYGFTQGDIPDVFERFEVLRKNRIAHARDLSQRYELGVVYRCKHGCDLEANGGVNDGVELRGRSFHIEHVALPEPNSERYAACQRKLARTTIETNSAPSANGAQAICCNL